MRQESKIKLLSITGIILACTSIVFLIISFLTIKEGIYPADGNGSLGHVGMTIAGIIAAFLMIFFGSLSWFCIFRARRLSRSTNHSTTGTS